MLQGNLDSGCLYVVDFSPETKRVTLLEMPKDVEQYETVSYVDEGGIVPFMYGRLLTPILRGFVLSFIFTLTTIIISSQSTALWYSSSLSPFHSFP